ncbi:hypothetical protein, partial [Pseudomonas urmiensis]|uniref:hypothetical protein n=1 Tax=Pseudomonas urmiensis TaxID=2745493 RepID=UPI0034D42F5F
LSCSPGELANTLCKKTVRASAHMLIMANGLIIAISNSLIIALYGQLTQALKVVHSTIDSASESVRSLS